MSYQDVAALLMVFVLAICILFLIKHRPPKPYTKEDEVKLVSLLDYHNAKVIELINRQNELTYNYKTADFQFLDRAEQARRNYEMEWYALKAKIIGHKEQSNKIAETLNSHKRKGEYFGTQQNSALV